MDDVNRDLGSQPMEILMKKWGLENHDLVEASTEQMTHKQVQKARTGRRVTLKMMMKVTRTLNVAIWYKLSKAEKESYFEYLHKHLFNYAKGYDETWADPNDEIIAARGE